MRVKLQIERPLLVLALAALLSGCAALKIDVDVYKGPMANSVEIQIEQMAAMAIGAKPLLIQLRNILEERSGGKPKEPFDCDLETEFKDRQARRVNGILCLYKDTTYEDAKLKALIDKGESYLKLMDAYEEAVERLSKGDATAVEEFKLAISNIFAFCLEMIEYVNSPPYRDRGPNVAELTEVCADLATILIEVGPLRDIAKQPKSKMSFSGRQLQDDLKQTLPILFADEVLNQKKIGPALKQRIKAELKQQLVKHPIKTSSILRNLNKYPFFRDHIGLTGVGDRLLTDHELRKIRLSLAVEIPGLSQASGLEGGRLPVGLETLIQEYLLAHEASRQIRIKHYAKNERDRLIDALARFAEKVRFMANNTILFGFDSQAATDKKAASGDKNRKKINQYVVVLQAISNSIGHHADELKQRFSHEKKLEEAGASELKALNSVLSQDPYVVVNTLITELSDKAERTDAAWAAAEKRKIKAEEDRKKAEENLASFENTSGIAQAAFDRASGVVTIDEKQYTKVLAAEAKKNFEPLERAGHIFLQQDGSILNWKNLETQYLKPGTPLPEGTKLSAEKFQKELSGYFAAAIDEQLKTVGSPEPKLVEWLQAAKKYVENLPSEEIILLADDTPSKLYSGFMRFFSSEYTKNEIDPAKLTAAISWSENLEKLVSANSELKAAQDQLNKINAEKTKITNAVNMIKAARPKIFAELDISEDRLTPSAVFYQLDFILRQMKDEAKASDPPGDTKPLDDAIDTLKEIPVPMHRAVAESDNLAKSDNSDDADKVLDKVIAALRHEHIQAVRMYGADSGIALKIQAALDTAYAHRARMAYIRPAMAYLRSSYPTTMVQDDAGLAWENMLGQHALRNIPFVGEQVANPDKDLLNTMSEIDKQFWHNINRVRLTGAGRTNYAVTKDDVGNWYVKGFSSDPTDIIQGAKSLALFGLGGTLNADLVGRSGEGAPSGGTESAQAPPVSWRQRRFDGFQDRYHAQTVEDHLEIKTVSEGLSDSIIQSWQAMDLTNEQLQTLQTALTEPNEKLAAFNKDKLPDDPSNEPELGHFVIDQLRALIRYHRLVDVGLDAKIKKYQANIEVARRNAEQIEANLQNVRNNLTDAKTEQRIAEKLSRLAAIDLESLEEKQNKDPASVSAESLDRVRTEKQEAEKKKAAADTRVSVLENELGTLQEAAGSARDSVTTALNESESKIKITQAARQMVTDLIRLELTRFLARRQTQLANYEAAIEVLGGD